MIINPPSFGRVLEQEFTIKLKEKKKKKKNPMFLFRVSLFEPWPNTATVTKWKILSLALLLEQRGMKRNETP